MDLSSAAQMSLTLSRLLGRMWFLFMRFRLNPEPVFLNRFAAPLWVFNFDIVSYSALNASSTARRCTQRWIALTSHRLSDG